MTLREWGRLLAKTRKAKGFSNAADFAAAVGVKQRTVENWEGGHYWPELPTMIQIVRVLGPEVDPAAVTQLSRIEGKLDRVLTLMGHEHEVATESSIDEVEGMPGSGDRRDESA